MKAGALVLAVLPLLALAGCARGCASRRPPIHLNPNMDRQPKYRPLAESAFFGTGSTSQIPPEGAIAQGELPEDESFSTGRSFFGGYIINSPLGTAPDVVARGRDRFAIYCVPCHGTAADGRGKLYQRSGVESKNLLDERIRAMPDGRIFEVATDGQGLMQGYRFPISTRDRWAIVAYVRELQRESSTRAQRERSESRSESRGGGAPRHSEEAAR